jgi:hypothetical protein
MYIFNEWQQGRWPCSTRLGGHFDEYRPVIITFPRPHAFLIDSPLTDRNDRITEIINTLQVLKPRLNRPTADLDLLMRAIYRIILMAVFSPSGFSFQRCWLAPEPKTKALPRDFLIFYIEIALTLAAARSPCSPSCGATGRACGGTSPSWSCRWPRPSGSQSGGPAPATATCTWSARLKKELEIIKVSWFETGSQSYCGGNWLCWTILV